jgi:hypothetical protein
MNNAEEKKYLELIKKQMKRHGLTSYEIGILDSRIGRIKITPNGWLRLLVPIKGYYYDNFEVYKIMHLDGELYFMVSEEHQTYDYPRKRENYRFTWDELVNMVETVKWSVRRCDFGGNGNTKWKLDKLKSIESSLRYYDAQEEAKWRKQPRLTDANIDVLVKVQESETSFAEKLVDKLFGY